MICCSAHLDVRIQGGPQRGEPRARHHQARVVYVRPGRLARALEDGDDVLVDLPLGGSEVEGKVG